MKSCLLPPKQSFEVGSHPLLFYIQSFTGLYLEYLTPYDENVEKFEVYVDMEHFRGISYPPHLIDRAWTLTSLFPAPFYPKCGTLPKFSNAHSNYAIIFGDVVIIPLEIFYCPIPLLCISILTISSSRFAAKSTILRRNVRNLIRNIPILRPHRLRRVEQTIRIKLLLHSIKLRIIRAKETLLEIRLVNITLRHIRARTRRYGTPFGHPIIRQGLANSLDC